MSCIIGEDEVNYSFNAHLLIDEYEVDFNSKSKFLALDWNPVLVGNVTSKLMLSVRDVTLLKKMENEARSKKRELDIISQLLNVADKKYLAFADSAKRFTAENYKQLEINEQRSQAAIALIFRNLHTIKGNCRTFGFDYLSDVVHDVESVYSALKTKPDAHWDRDKLLRDLAHVENILQEYDDVYYKVLGRGENGGDQREPNNFLADKKTIEIIQNSIDTANQRYPELQNTQPLLPIQSLLDCAMSHPLSEVLSDIITSLPTIALELDKEAPKIIIMDNQIRIKFSAAELVTNIFSHILRNSVDHGIETTEVRLQAGKPISGTIEIHALPQQEHLHIYVKDDGQGINVDKLFKKGIEIGQWQAEDKPSYSDIANIIFASGVSTKETITSISGRGVGMDAVKEFLLAQNGNIFIRLLNDNSNDQNIGQAAMVPFELVIELPKNMITLSA
ncbi:MAG: ATP-binding protein [Pseudomonadota bacterium]